MNASHRDWTRQRFDVRYYLVAIEFLIFDVELLLLYPWAVAQWSADPALAAATLFAALLDERGLSIDGPQPGSAVGSVIAETESVPLATMVETMLTESDNDMAEQLAHLAGAELTGVGGIRRDDPVIGIHHDARLGQAVEEGKQLTEKMRSHVEFVIFAKII